jgi:hypothetical protein
MRAACGDLVGNVLRDFGLIAMELEAVAVAVRTLQTIKALLRLY